MPKPECWRPRSDATARMLGTPRSVAIDRRHSSTPAPSNRSTSARTGAGSVPGSSHSASGAPSTMDRIRSPVTSASVMASRSTTSQSAWQTASSRLLPEARPLVVVTV